MGERRDRECTRKPPALPVARFLGARSSGRPPQVGKLPSKDVEPLDWSAGFEARMMVKANGVQFCAYTSNLNSGSEAIALLIHGAGCSALSFGVLAQLLSVEIGVIAVDQRAHGDTECDDSIEYELDIDTLVRDAAAATRAVFAQLEREIPPLVLVGHSAGGSVAARLAADGELPVCATVLIDVTEGTALQALPYMGAWVSSRPRSFSTLSGAILYVMGKGHVRNLESARISVPAQLRQKEGLWYWRTDLGRTEQYWRGWFEGLSEIFLSPAFPKLAGSYNARLGGDLSPRVSRLAYVFNCGTVRFQNILLPTAGHSIHEDEPEKVATAVLDFMQRNLLISASGDVPSVPSPVFQQRAPLL